jgi:transcriptional regulator with XRE-family HTH domain
MNTNPPRYRRRRPFWGDGLPLHERIRRRRLSLALTGQELAERAGVSPPYISLIEKGVKIPSEDVADAIARALGDDPELYRAWAQSYRLEDVESAWSRLHLARRYANSPMLRRRLSSGEDLEDETAAARAEYEAEAAEARPAAAAETGARESLDERPEERPLREDRFVPSNETPRERPVSGRAERTHGFLWKKAVAAASGGALARLRREAEPLEIPVLDPGADPGSGGIPPESVLDVLLLDPRVLGREKPRRPFAYRLNEATIARVQDLYRRGDWVVIDSRPGVLTADRVHAVRLHGRVILSRVIAKRDSLLLLPTEGESDVQVLDLPPGESPDRVIVGCVVATVRGEG